MSTNAYLDPSTTWPLEMSQPARILVLERHDRSRSQLVGELVIAGWEVIHARTPADALVAWVGSRRPIDLLVVDPFSTGDAGLRLCRALRSVQSDLGLLVWAPVPGEVEAEAAVGPSGAVPEHGLLTREVRRQLDRRMPRVDHAARPFRGTAPRPPVSRLRDRWPLLQIRGLWGCLRQLGRGNRADLD
jgi:CheY-like chemotaxis protein